MEVKKDLNIKILVAYHKPYKIFKNDIFVPIHVGRSVAFEKSKDGIISKQDYQWLLENTIGDDTGENISSRNREFAELTAIYWAWKNYDKLGNPDYIGLMHYRTYFDFTHYIKTNNQAVPEKGFYNKDFFADVFKKYDMVVAKTINIKTDFQEPRTFDNLQLKYWRFSSTHYENLYQMLKIYNNNIHFKNMFILKKEDFFIYCKILFDILFTMKIHEINNDRIFAYHAEVISSLIFMWLYKIKGRSHLDLPFILVHESLLFKFENLLKRFIKKIFFKRVFSVKPLYCKNKDFL